MGSVSSLNSLLSSSNASSSLNLSSLLTAATGASSVGIDVNSAVDAAIYAARAPERNWQAQQSTIQAQSSAVGSIQTALTSIMSDLQALSDPLGVLATKAVTSSDDFAVSAKASSSAALGSHTISVQSLATTSSWYSMPLSSADVSVGTSVLEISPSNQAARQFALGPGGSRSIAAVATAINAAGMGISASVISDPTGSRLSLVSATTGNDSDFAVSSKSTGEASWDSASVASAGAALGASTLNLNDGSQSSTLSVAAGSTLQIVAAQINASGLDLNATVATDSAGAHLNVVPTKGGSVTLNEDPVFTFVQSSSGHNAQLQVDGVPVASSSNVVSGAIPGVTLNLTGVTAGQNATVQVAADASQISSAISTFVTDYNSALSLVSNQFTYSSSTNSQGVLGSDSTIRALQSALLKLATYSSGAPDSGSASSLSVLGITVKDDGSLSLDSTALNQTLTSDPSSVQGFLLGNASNGFISNARSQMSSFSSPGSGALAIDMNSLQQQSNNLQNEISDFEIGYIASQQTILTNMYSRAEAALQQLPEMLKQIDAQLGTGNSGS